MYIFALSRHARGEGVDTTKVRTKFKAKEQARREERVEFANVQAARAEVRSSLKPILTKVKIIMTYLQ